MTPELLARAGRALAGDEWRRPLARALGPLHPDGPREELDQRLVSRWSLGQREIPGWVRPALVGLLWRRARDLHAEADEAASVADALMP
ncbi:hypothetical protein [Methylobacterium gnaphalii]|uniref:Uncharacterized protein n=1 Tax=Methylobacterium gnaphalii TaxID=1010610 RepID=A0A512JFW8_9HYPH|nr:hypothetical protein [Methylobacterium gnaphalii]GEP08845.1 hypothetical protein MGN01_06900 [Methylobacterium gnaphalii]GJD70372.1 hypothetical protein MMMDOFMJ_3318 [Methylobacterium gnaphalii]GLS47610.1 hypothetical protein GCM10007885_04540 [Methylobacterium gnaphalii]